MFIGQSNNSIDDKSRLIIPTKFREELGDTCILTMGLDNCLYIYSMKAWEEFSAKLDKVPLSDKQGRSFVRFFTKSAHTGSIDKQGRLTIPAKHKEYAGIDKEVVAVGTINRIELWSAEYWNDNEDDIVPPAEIIEADMSRYGI